MLIVDSTALRRVVVAGKDQPVPLIYDAADVEITTPFGTYAMSSAVLSRVSEFFSLSMSERWNSKQQQQRLPPSCEPIKFRYWLPADSYLVDRNPITYGPVCTLPAETVENATTLDHLFRAIHNLPLPTLDLPACNRLVEAADAYNCLAHTPIAAVVSAYWATAATTTCSLPAAIHADPWQFLLAAFQIRDRAVFDRALAHCVGVWHALPTVERALLSTRAVPEDDLCDDVFEMRYLPDALQRVVLDAHRRLLAQQEKTNAALRRVAAEPELDGLAKLDAMLSATTTTTAGGDGWESQSAYAARQARRVVRAFVADNLLLSRTAPRPAYARLRRGLRVKPDTFFAAVDFEMVRHEQALRAVSDEYCRALLAMAREFKDPDLLLQIHRFHKAMAEFQGEIEALVEALCDDALDGEDAEGQGESVRVLLCAKVPDGKYPWRLERDWRREKKRLLNETVLGRKARKCDDVYVGFVRGHGACG